MYYLKRAIYITLVLLFFMSIYKDLSFITPHQEESPAILVNSKLVNVTKVKVLPGDTVLSIAERLNTNINIELNIKQLITDFEMINPNTDPYSLQINSFYYFPVY